ncbi:alpha/beta hydrolase [Amycolatopsis benzoatilytica]|uniref:alpha/beta hydrolase n=1 Tax=Amycolatopsis benzoatilytica TaxID=346045 RepID=UPI00037F18B8|nr:alpha/beta hydrolase [Amycolatopsis benzoatilytica]
MITWGDVRRWNPAQLAAAVDALGDRAAKLTQANDDADAMTKFGSWQGAAADAATAKGTALSAELRQLTVDVAAVRRGVSDAQPGVERVVSAARELDDFAVRNGMRIDDSGTVSGEPERQGEIADRVGQVLREAAEIDADLTVVLDRATRGESGSGGTVALAMATTSRPKPNGTAAENRAWWDSLSDSAQSSILRDNPDLIRNLDGIPVVDRDSANRVVLQQEIDKLAADDPKQRGLAAIRDRLAATGDGKPPAFLVALDTSGDGTAVVAAGNPDTAANVATYVPGTGSDLAKIGGDLGRSDKMWQSATMAGSPSTAVITWVGYDAPNELTDAASEKYADGGKVPLQKFEDGLRASHEGAPSHNTVLGHSYGTTVIGHAARDGGLNADDLIFAGSPGVGVDHANQLHLNGVPQDQVGQHVHSTVAQHDLIKITNIGVAGFDPLGPDPAGNGFGGDVFASAPGDKGPWYEGGLSGAAHSQYWEDNNPSLRSFGRIIAGLPA